MGYPQAGGPDFTLTSWGSANFYSTLTSAIKVSEITFDTVEDEPEPTGINATTALEIGALTTTTGTIRGYAFATPRLGNIGQVAWSSGGYTVHVESVTLTAETIGVHDITAMVGTTNPPEGHVFRPDSVRWFAEYVCKIDSATDLAKLALPTTSAATLTLTYGDETPTDDTLAGTAFAKRLGKVLRVGDVARATYRAKGTGNLVAAGTASIFGSYTFSVPVWHQGAAPTYSGGAANAATEMTITGQSGTYLIDAFWRSIRLSWGVGTPVEIEIDWQGNGPLRGTGVV